MKALIILSAFLCQPILAGTPTEALKSFRKAAKKEDFAATWKVTARFDGLHPKLVEYLEGELRQSWELFATGWDFEILEEKVSGDCAVVVVNEVRKEGSRGGIDPDPACLIKQDGEWRVFPDPSGREAAQQLAKQHAATYQKLEKWFKDRKVVLKDRKSVV